MARQIGGGSGFLTNTTRNNANFVPEEYLLAALKGELSDTDYLAQACDGLTKQQKRESYRKEVDDHIDPAHTLRRGVSSLLPLKRAHKAGSFHFEDFRLLAQPGYLDLEHGYTFIPSKGMTSETSGVWFIAILTNMGEVTGEMYKWWVNFCDSSTKYKWSHPYGHKSCIWSTAFYSVPANERMVEPIISESAALATIAEDETEDASPDADATQQKKENLDYFIGEKFYTVLSLSAAAKNSTTRDSDGNVTDVENAMASTAAAAVPYSFANQVVDADVIITAGTEKLMFEYLNPTDYIEKEELIANGVTACLVKKIFRLQYNQYDDNSIHPSHRLSSSSANATDKVTLATFSVPKIVHIGYMVQMMRETSNGSNELRTRVWINSNCNIQTTVTDAQGLSRDQQQGSTTNTSESTSEVQSSPGGLFSAISSFFMPVKPSGSESVSQPTAQDNRNEAGNDDNDLEPTAYSGFTCTPLKRSDIKKLVMHLNNNIGFVLMSHFNEENICIRSFLPACYKVNAAEQRGRSKRILEPKKILTKVGSLLRGSLYEDSSGEEDDDDDDDDWGSDEVAEDFDTELEMMQPKSAKKVSNGPEDKSNEKLTIAQLKAQKESIKETKNRFVQQYLEHKMAEKNKKVTKKAPISHPPAHSALVSMDEIAVDLTTGEATLSTEGALTTQTPDSSAL